VTLSILHLTLFANNRYFLDHENTTVGEKPFTDSSVEMVDMVNATFGDDGGLMKSCHDGLLERGMDVRLCIMAEHVIEFVKTPVFAFNSKFDSFQLENILQAYNFTDDNDREADLQYGVDFVEQLQPLMDDSKNGAFITSCICHGCPWEALQIDGKNSFAHYGQWVDEVINGDGGGGGESHFTIDASVEPNGGPDAAVSDGYQKCEAF